MISAQRLKQYLHARPFRPFRLYLSDGSYHDVPHPEFAWVFGTTVFVGIPGKSSRQPEDYVKEIAMLHITRVQKLTPEDKKKTTQTKK